MAVGDSSQLYSQQFSGTVSSSQSTTLSFSVPGTITNLYVSEGQKVAKGQLIAKVRDGEYLNAYNIARAQLAEAQDGYNRLKKLHDANALPEVKWVEMEQKLKQAQNAAEMAQRSLNDANLHSPVAGTVSSKFVDVGQTVIPAQPVCEIISTDNLEIVISVSESQISSFNQGDKALVTLEAVGSSPIEGKVTQKAVEADPLTRSFPIKIALPKNDKILPGMIGNVVFPGKSPSSSSQEGIILPSRAVLLNNDNRWFVWLAVDSVAQRRFITADFLTNSGVIVTSGLNPGDIVIVDGTQKVSSGTRLTFAN